MSIEKIIDKVKINLFAEVLGTLAVFGFGVSFYDLKLNLYEVPLLLFSTLNAFQTVYNVKRQNTRYNKLEKLLEEYEYREAAFAQYMDHPCGRAVVKTVLKRNGLNEKYEELKNKYPLTRLV